MASGGDNPNTHDLPVSQVREQQQVMSSPTATTAQRGGGQGPLMNGIPGPLRGSQDIDGEVRANPEPMVATGEAARPVEGPSAFTPAAPTGGMGESMMSLAAATDVGASGPDGRTTAQGAVVTEPRGERSGSAQGPGSVLSGVLRAVQTLPAAVEGLVSRSGSGRGIPARQDCGTAWSMPP